MPEETPEADLEELSRVAGLFKLPQLQTICLNLQNEEEFLNPSIGTFLNDETGATMKTMFFNQPEYSDVVLQRAKVGLLVIVLVRHYCYYCYYYY